MRSRSIALKKVALIFLVSLCVVTLLRLVSRGYQPPKRAQYTIMRAEMGFGEYPVEVSDADHFAAGNGCITYWFEGQSQERPHGAVCGKVWTRIN